MPMITKSSDRDDNDKNDHYDNDKDAGGKKEDNDEYVAISRKLLIGMLPQICNVSL